MAIEGSKRRGERSGLRGPRGSANLELTFGDEVTASILTTISLLCKEMEFGGVFPRVPLALCGMPCDKLKGMSVSSNR
jgi:hypothetical protein